jgi:pimeloyl-ACP methyl ester carboxylesterase
VNADSIWLPGAGVRVHGLDWGPAGADRLILLLHGVAGNAHIWDATAHRLQRILAGAARIVALDGRDGGLTDHPPSGYGPADLAADLVSVHDALGGRELTLVGHSRGGWLAAYFAALHAGRVSRLVLVDPARLSFATDAASDRFFKRVREGLGPFPSRAAALDWGRAEDPDGDWNPDRERGFLANYREREDGSLVGHLPPHAVDQLRRPAADDPVGPLLARISCPTLLMVGTRQAPERVSDKLVYAERIPRCEVRRFDASHFIHTDQPDLAARAIADFLGG